MVLEAPGSRARAAWKVAGLAAAAVLVVVAGESFRRGGALSVSGAAFTGLEAPDPPKYVLYNNYGCKNWEDIQINRTVVPNEATCQHLCEESSECVAYNWQGRACQPGWKVKNACITFKGVCQTEKNTCWEMFYKLTYRDAADAVEAD